MLTEDFVNLAAMGN